MSYCMEEGNARYVFATDEDLNESSKAIITDIPPEQEDMSAKGFVLPNGELNWECPCRGSMVAEKCGVEFRDFFTCIYENKDKINDFSCMPYFDKLESCMEKHPEFYHLHKYPDTDIFNDDNTNSKVTLNPKNDVTLNSSENVNVTLNSEKEISVKKS